LAVDPPSKGISVKGVRSNLVKGVKALTVKPSSPSKSFTRRTSKEKIETKKL
jgi:hypothetical protein